MFNPQRKSKVSDIFMQQKIYKLHLAKMHQIQNSGNQRSKRYLDEKQQQIYMDRLQKSKKQIKERQSTDIKSENTRLMKKLLETDQRRDLNPERKTIQGKHFNSYFTTKKQRQRIHQQNYTMVMRMDKNGPGVPSLKQLKQQYRRSRKFAKNCRKLPSIMRNQQLFKRKVSQPSLQSRVRSTHRLD